MSYSVVLPEIPRLAARYQPPPFWHSGAPVLSDDGLVTHGGMFAHQKLWWDLSNFVRLFVGGFGAGKTMIMCKRMIGLALTNAPYPVALVSPTYQMARETTIATIEELLGGKRTLYGPGQFKWRYNQSSHKFSIWFKGVKATVIIYSGDNPDSLRGPNLAAAGIDEPFIQDEAVFNQMVARVRHPAARRLEINLAGTPEQLNWGYELAEGELADNFDVGTIHAGTGENLALDPAYSARLLAAFDGKAAQAYVGGQFVHLGTGNVYYGFNPAEQMVTLSRPVGSELGVGMDFNVDPMAAAVFWKAGNHIHFIAEIELANSDTEEMCGVLRERYPELLEAYPDASGKNRSSTSPGGRSDYTFIKRAGMHINAKGQNPARRDRYNAVNGKFKAKEGRFSLTLDPKLKKLKRCLSTYSHPLMNRTEQKAMSHLLDAFSYPIAFLFPVDKRQFVAKRIRGA